MGRERPKSFLSIAGWGVLLLIGAAAKAEPFQLLSAVDGVVHQQQMSLRMSQQSLQSGWVEMEQCHREMAPTGRSAVQFRAGKVRDLELLRHEQIGRAWVNREGTAIELEGIERSNVLCLRGELQILQPQGEGYRLQSGPYFLRFLDGYFPLQLTLRIESDAAGLRLQQLLPEQIPYQLEQGEFTLDLLFEGELLLELFLVPETF